MDLNVDGQLGTEIRSDRTLPPANACANLPMCCCSMTELPSAVHADITKLCADGSARRRWIAGRYVLGVYPQEIRHEDICFYV